MSARVTIGLPTYNRVTSLERAVESVLAQSVGDLELVIADNASTDGTEELCRRYAERDPRVRYIRHEVNVGPTANFNYLFGRLTGEYAMLLADDDWLEPDYLEACLRELERLPDHVLVGGWHRWMRDGTPAGDGVLMELRQEDPRERVLEYLRRVDDNGSFYGLMRGDALRRVGPMSNALGNDWSHVAAIAFCGKLRTLPSTRINRSLGGTSRTLGEIVSTFGAGRRLESRLAFVFISARVFAEVAWRSSVYAPMGRVGRLLFGARAFAAALRIKGSIWLLLGPAVMSVLRRRRGRWLHRPFAWMVHRAGRSVDTLPPL